MQTKLIISDPQALNPPIDRMINNFIEYEDAILLSVGNFQSNWDVMSALITYKWKQ